MNLFAALIKFFQKTDYSHYAMSYVSESGNIMFCDSTSTGVRTSESAKFLKKNEIKRIYKSSIEIERYEFLFWIEKHLGKGYGFSQIIGLLLKVLGIVKNNPFGKGSKRIICNEIIILFINMFYEANIKDTDSLDLNDTERLIKEVSL